MATKRKPKAPAVRTEPATTGFEFESDTSVNRERFVDELMGEDCAGNATQAYLNVYDPGGKKGMSRATAANSASRLMRIDEVRAAIDERIKSDPMVASRHRIQRFLTDAMDNVAVEMKDRIAAAKLLEQTRGGLTHKHDVTVHEDLGVLSDDELDARALEAGYVRATPREADNGGNDDGTTKAESASGGRKRRGNRRSADERGGRDHPGDADD